MERVLQQQMHHNRKYFKLEFITGMSQFSMVTGAFLTGYIHMLGGSDSLNGFIGALPAILGFLQIASALYFERMTQRKNSLVKVITPLRIMLGMCYIIPLFFMRTAFALPVFVALYVISFALNAFAMPALNELLINSTPQAIRGRYLAERERIGFAVMMVLTFAIGRMLDLFKGEGQEPTGFVVIAIVILVLGAFNTFSVKSMNEITHNQVAVKFALKEVLTKPLADKGFRKIIVLFILWNVGFWIGAPFIAVYLVTQIQVSYTYMMIMGFIGTIMRIVFPKFWGELADKKSWFLSLEGSLLLVAITHFAWGFVHVGNYQILSPLLHVLAGFAWSGLGISLFNIQYMYAGSKGRTLYVGLNAAIGGVASLIAVRFSGSIIDRFEVIEMPFGGGTLNSMQFIFFISGLVILSCVFYVRYFLKKEPVNVEE